MEGHFFIKVEKENDPLVKVFYIPACHLVGYKYTIEERGGEFVLIDGHQYDEKKATDEEFIRLKREWQARKTG